MNEEQIKITCHVKILSKDGKFNDLLKVLESCAAESRKEIGCEYHEIVQNIAEPNLITLIEKFSNYNSFQLHMQNPVIRDFIDFMIIGKLFY